MIRHDGDELAMMNASVALVVLIPLLLFMTSGARARPTAVVGGAHGHDERLEAANDQPPILTVSDAEVFSFATGSAVISPALARFLTDTVVPSLVDFAVRYQCDVIEVIGHTDSQIVKSMSTLDTRLLTALQGATVPLSAGSNADLGLMRAWAVATYLRRDVRLQGKTLFGYSAAHAIGPDGHLVSASVGTTDAPQRRRVEIRMRRRVGG